VAKNVTNTIDHITQDCWLCGGFKPTENKTYPTISIQPLKKYYKERQGERYWGVDKKRNTTCYRITSSLLHKDMEYNDRTKQCAHRCYRAIQICISPYHIVIKNDAENKSMGHCVNGCFIYCDHEPKCIFVDEKGHYLPCRNDVNILSYYDECDHNPNCYAYLVKNKINMESLLSLQPSSSKKKKIFSQKF